MRVAFYFENYVVGGASKYVKDCINAVYLQDHKVELLSNRGAFSTVELEQMVRPIKHCVTRVFERTQSVERMLGRGRLAILVRKSLIVITPVLFVLNVLEVWLRLGATRTEVLVACNGGYPASQPALAAVIAARLRKLPSVLVIMSTPRTRRRILLLYEMFLDRLIFASVSTIVVNSKIQSLNLQRFRCAPEGKITILYNGIPDTVQQRKEQPLIRASITLGVICRLDPMKGLDYLISALALLPDWIKLRIVGTGESRESLEQLVNEEGIEDRIIFTGFIKDEDLLKELDKFDIYVFPSLWEGFPYSLLEAMRAGLPIISTNVGGISEMITDGIEGLLVPSASPRALVDAINTLLSDKELARYYGSNARRRYEDLFSLNQMHEKFYKIIAEAKLQN